MAVLFNTPTISISQVAPPVTIFDGLDGDLTDLTGLETIKRGADSYSMPRWAQKGVNVDSDCGCHPEPYKAKWCHQEDWPIKDNYEVTELPLNMIFQGGNPKITAQPKTYTERDGCCLHLFKPMEQYLRLKLKDRCETELRERATQYLQAKAHRIFIDQLMRSANGNVSIPMVANVVNPLDGDGNPICVSDCNGLTALQENHDSLRRLIAPMAAVNSLLSSGQIGRDEQGLYVISSGTRITVDPSWKGRTGPPLTPWDGTADFDPATDFTEPDDGCVWLYMTGPIVGSAYLERQPELPQNGDEDTIGNTETALAEMQTIAVFDPCDVAGVQININKVVGCG